MTRPPHQPVGEAAVADVAALLRRTVFRSVPDETIESLLAGGRTVTFDAGTTVHAEDDAEGFGLVIRGLLRVYMHAGSGREVTVRYARSGALLGVPALIGGPPPVFVQALIPAAVFVFDVDRVRRIARDDPALAWAFASEAVERLYDVLEELAGNTFASVRQRVARHLLDLAASHASSTTPLTARVSQQDLANSVGSVREVVARVLSELKAERLIRTAPGRIDVLDPARLSAEVWSRDQ